MPAKHTQTGGKSYRQSPKVKRLIRERDGGRCKLCGCGLGDSCELHWAVVSQMDIAHIIPWKDGGPSTPENLRLLCHPCNMREMYGGAGSPVVVDGRYLKIK